MRRWWVRCERIEGRPLEVLAASEAEAQRIARAFLGSEWECFAEPWEDCAEVEDSKGVVWLTFAEEEAGK